MVRTSRFRLLVALTLAFSLTRTLATANDENPGHASHQMRLAVSCLVKAPYLRENLESVGLTINGSAIARYHVGEVPGLEPMPKEMQIIIYAKNGRDAWLFFADPNASGGFMAVRNAYRLKRVGNRWTAGYGNGGPAVYDAIGRFATKLSQKPSFSVRLVPGGAMCTTDN